MGLSIWLRISLYHWLIGPFLIKIGIILRKLAKIWIGYWHPGAPGHRMRKPKVPSAPTPIADAIL